MTKLYGKRQSRAARCMWVLEEMGLPYEQVPIDTQNGDTQRPEYLALNPSGKVPTLDDDGFVLRESLAISAYLVTKTATALWPDDVHAQALIQQWSSWAATELEAPLSAIFRARRRAAAAGVEADANFITDCLSLAAQALTVLEQHLASHEYVVGDAFTLGDINACGTVMLAPMFLSLTDYPAVQEWMARCVARPAWKRVETRA